MLDELLKMIAAREELSATHPKYAQRTIRPIALDQAGDRTICSTFSSSDMRYRLARLTDADLRPYSRPGWTVRRTARPAPSLAGTLNTLAVYSSGMAEALVLAWQYEIPVVFPYRKEDGSTRTVTALVTWAADDHGNGEVFGVIDLDRKAPRTFKLHGVQTMTLRPSPGQALPVWVGDRWACELPATWGEVAKAGAAKPGAPGRG